MTINAASTLYFAQPDALKGSLAQTLLEVRPTLFPGVPRWVYLKIMVCDTRLSYEVGNPSKKSLTEV